MGINSAQSLHHFIAKSPWSVTEIRNRRLSKILSALKDKSIPVVIDETGDRKKGKKTDYVARQYHHLWLGFHDLIQVMNQFQPYFPDG